MKPMPLLLIAALAGAALFAAPGERISVGFTEYYIDNPPTPARQGYQLRFVVDTGTRAGLPLTEYLYEYGLDAENRALEEACQRTKFPWITVYNSLWSQETLEYYGDHYARVKYCSPETGRVRELHLPELGQRVARLREQFSNINYNQDTAYPRPEYPLIINEDNRHLLPYYARYPLTHPRIIKEILLHLLTEGPFSWEDGYTPAWLLKGHSFAADNLEREQSIVLTGLYDEQLSARELDHERLWARMNRALGEKFPLERFQTAFGERSSLSDPQLAAMGFRPSTLEGLTSADEPILDQLSLIYGAPDIVIDDSANLGIISLSAESHFGLSLTNFLGILESIGEEALKRGIEKSDALGVVEIEACDARLFERYYAWQASFENETDIFSPSGMLWYTNKDYTKLAEDFSDESMARARGFRPGSAAYLGRLIQNQWEGFPNYSLEDQ